MNTTVPTSEQKDACGFRSEGLEQDIEPLCEDCEGCLVMAFSLIDTNNHSEGIFEFPFIHSLLKGYGI